MKKVKPMIRIRRNPYSSMMKKYWNEARSKVNELMKVHDMFKFRMRELQRSNKTEAKYRSDFIGIVNMTYGSYLGMIAEDFSDCKLILTEAKNQRCILHDACLDIKWHYHVANIQLYKEEQWR